MKKSKKVLISLGLIGIACLGSVLTAYFKPKLDFASKIEKELGEHLDAKYGQAHRKVSCIVIFNAMFIIFSYPATYLEAHPDLETECRSYIAEHYPQMVSFVKKIIFKKTNVPQANQE